MDDNWTPQGNPIYKINHQVNANANMTDLEYSNVNMNQQVNDNANITHLVYTNGKMNHQVHAKVNMTDPVDTKSNQINQRSREACWLFQSRLMGPGSLSIGTNWMVECKGQLWSSVPLLAWQQLINWLRSFLTKAFPIIHIFPPIQDTLLSCWMSVGKCVVSQLGWKHTFSFSMSACGPSALSWQPPVAHPPLWTRRNMWTPNKLDDLWGYL